MTTASTTAGTAQTGAHLTGKDTAFILSAGYRCTGCGATPTVTTVVAVNHKPDCRRRQPATTGGTK